MKATENVNNAVDEKTEKLEDSSSNFDRQILGKRIDVLCETLDLYEDLRYLVGMNEEGYIYVSAQDLQRLYSYV